MDNQRTKKGILPGFSCGAILVSALLSGCSTESGAPSGGPLIFPGHALRLAKNSLAPQPSFQACHNPGGQHSPFYTFLGGAGEDYAWSLCATPEDGGMLAVGSVSASMTLPGQMLQGYYGGTDAVAIRLNPRGDVLWYTFLGGEGSSEYISAVTRSHDGGYVLAGKATKSFDLEGKAPLHVPLNEYGTYTDAWVLKLDADGHLVWHTFLGGSRSDRAANVTVTADGGYLMVGSAGSDIPVLAGSTPPVNSFSGPPGKDEGFVVKLNTNGEVKWHTFVGAPGARAVLDGVVGAPDEGFLVTGTAGDLPSLENSTVNPIIPFNPAAPDSGLALKLTSDAHVQWYTHIGSVEVDNHLYGATLSHDDGFLLVGQTRADIPTLQGVGPVNPFVDTDEGLVVKLRGDGKVEWYTFLGGLGTNEFFSIAPAAEGGMAVAGYTEHDIPNLEGKLPVHPYTMLGYQFDGVVVRLNRYGNVEWYTFTGENSSANTIVQSGGGGFAVGGFSETPVLPEYQGKNPNHPHTQNRDAKILNLGATGSIWE